MLFNAFNKSFSPRKPLFCANNLKQLALASRIWAGDNNDKLPVEIAAAAGGALEFTNADDAWKIFQVMSNELSTPKILVCPDDSKHTVAATNFSAHLQNKISYFISLDTIAGNPQAPLAGDDNLVVNGVPVPPGILNLSGNSASWTQERHSSAGYVALVDGSVHLVRRIGFNSSADTLFATNRLAIP